MVETGQDPPEPAVDAAESLLPWYVSGALDAADRAAVERWLQHNPVGRERLAQEQALAAMIDGAAGRIDAGAADAGWAAMAAQIAPAPSLPPHLPPALPPRRVRRAWLARPRQLATGAMAAAAAVTAVLVVQPPARDARYTALSTPQPATRSASIIVSFRPGTSEAAMRAALATAAVEVVQGPTATGAWLLAPRAGDAAAAVARLQKDASVAIAAPIDQAAP